jgi:hypothetical protein
MSVEYFMVKSYFQSQHFNWSKDLGVPCNMQLKSSAHSEHTTTLTCHIPQYKHSRFTNPKRTTNCIYSMSNVRFNEVQSIRCLMEYSHLTCKWLLAQPCQPLAGGTKFSSLRRITSPSNTSPCVCPDWLIHRDKVIICPYYQTNARLASMPIDRYTCQSAPNHPRAMYVYNFISFPTPKFLVSTTLRRLGCKVQTL